jgi:methionyl-tRNA formyltransferase
MKSLKIIFAGTPDFAASSLRALLDQGYNVCAVYTQPDRPAGRGQHLQISPVKSIALQHNLPIFQPSSLKTPDAQAQLIDLNADLMIVAAYGLLLPKAVLEAPKLGCINVHASLLPRWRGAAPIQRAILAGDSTTGITIMQMDIGLDTGAMLLKMECPILPTDTGESLHDKLALLGGNTLILALENWKTLKPEPQDNNNAIYAKKLDKSEAQLDWNLTAVELDRQIRAFNPYPVAQATINGMTLRIWQAQPIQTRAENKVGSISYANKNGVDIATGDGILRLLTVQQAGKRILTIGDFLNAHPNWRT